MNIKKLANNTHKSSKKIMEKNVQVEKVGWKTYKTSKKEKKNKSKTKTVQSVCIWLAVYVCEHILHIRYSYSYPRLCIGLQTEQKRQLNFCVSHPFWAGKTQWTWAHSHLNQFRFKCYRFLFCFYINCILFYDDRKKKRFSLLNPIKKQNHFRAIPERFITKDKKKYENRLKASHFFVSVWWRLSPIDAKAACYSIYSAFCLKMINKHKSFKTRCTLQRAYKNIRATTPIINVQRPQMHRTFLLLLLLLLLCSAYFV